jgi:hypothetical protein
VELLTVILGSVYDSAVADRFSEKSKARAMAITGFALLHKPRFAATDSTSFVCQYWNQVFWQSIKHIELDECQLHTLLWGKDSIKARSLSSLRKITISPTATHNLDHFHQRKYFYPIPDWITAVDTVVMLVENRGAWVWELLEELPNLRDFTVTPDPMAIIKVPSRVEYFTLAGKSRIQSIKFFHPSPMKRISILDFRLSLQECNTDVFLMNNLEVFNVALLTEYFGHDPFDSILAKVDALPGSLQSFETHLAASTHLLLKAPPRLKRLLVNSTYAGFSMVQSSVRQCSVQDLKLLLSSGLIPTEQTLQAFYNIVRNYSQAPYSSDKTAILAFHLMDQCGIDCNDIYMSKHGRFCFLQTTQCAYMAPSFVYDCIRRGVSVNSVDALGRTILEMVLRCVSRSLYEEQDLDVIGL